MSQLHKLAVEELIKEKSPNFKANGDALDIYDLIYKHPKISGSEIATMMGITPIKVREHIQDLRMFWKQYNYKTLNSYLIAHSSGYEITSNIHKIKKYYDKTSTRYKNTTLQLLQMELILGEENI